VLPVITLHMVHLSKLCCYSNRWLWVRLNFILLMCWRWRGILSSVSSCF